MRPTHIPKAIINKGLTTTMMRKRRDAGKFTCIGDAIELQKAERELRLEKRKVMALVEDIPGG